jgi:hypothetical protein
MDFCSGTEAHGRTLVVAACLCGAVPGAELVPSGVFLEL